MKYLLPTLLLSLTTAVLGNQVSDSQHKYIAKYEKQTQKVAPGDALLNTDPEPDLTEGFVSLYNGKDLDGWIPRGGYQSFEAQGDKIVGKVIQGSPSTYLCTKREDYGDFILAAELFWVENSNSGVMIRARHKPGDKYEVVYGPQVEMEGFSPRGWSGGIYGQSFGAWRYPLWLDAHKEARQALNEGQWNRVTILCDGPTVKTWINGTPAAHWVNDEHLTGLIGLQIHSGQKGEVHFRNIKIRELNTSPEIDLFASGDFSDWTQVNGAPVGKGWEIEEGVIHRSGLKPGDIITREHFDDFDLRFEWKIAKGGNSGVKYRARGRLGLEYQVLDDEKHPNGKDPLSSAAAMYALVAPARDKPLTPAGEWNAGRIVTRGDHVEHWLNGVKVLETNLAGNAWKEQFQKSKYKGNENFGSWTGPILLQDHGDEVWFKNVRIRKLHGDNRHRRFYQAPAAK